MQFLVQSLLLATAVLAAPHRNIQHRHMSPKRDSLARMSSAEVEAIYKTCWGGNIPWPVRMPVKDIVTPQLDVFPRPTATPNQLTVANYCSYPISYMHWDGSEEPAKGTLEAGATINRGLGGTVFKASKNPDMSNDLLIEYNVGGGALWYNLSLITCVKGEDLSACPGHEGGLQLGNSVSKSFQCAANSWCDDQAYIYQENLCKKENPVSACDPGLGLTMEFCAGAKPGGY